MKNIHDVLKAKEINRQEKLYKYVYIPLCVLLSVGFIGAAIYLYGNSMTGAMSAEKGDNAFFASMAVMSATLFGIMAAVLLPIGRSVYNPPDSNKLPLLCSCGRDKATVYAVPVLRFTWPLWATGTVMGAVIAFMIVGDISLLVMLPALLFYAAIIFVFSFAEYAANKHTVKCAAKRGFVNVGYYLFAYFMSKMSDPYVKR